MLNWGKDRVQVWQEIAAIAQALFEKRSDFKEKRFFCAQFAVASQFADNETF